MVTAYYATLRNSAIAVAINPLYRDHELAVHFKDSGAETVVAVEMIYPPGHIQF